MLGGDSVIVLHTVLHTVKISCLGMTWLRSNISKYPFHFATREIRAHSTGQPGLQPDVVSNTKNNLSTHTERKGRGSGAIIVS